ncbi:MAG: tryptophanase [Bacteroidetes bacterium]|jgi:tryptophanase|nr:tryptophanase [Bacteroidota bacterium]
MHKTIIEPFRIKMVEPIYMSTPDQRKQHLENAKYNPFLLHSDQVIIDLLTDSGTSAMSANQWAGIMRGDESYAGAKSWERFQQTIIDITGFTHILPTHQGRAAERILYTHLGGPEKVFISNTHFDTTRANIEYTHALALDCPADGNIHDNENQYFKGNIDLHAVEGYIRHYGPERIAAVILTVTNNSGGGQPVSMANARALAHMCQQYGVLMVLDCCRIAENAYFIKHFEEGYSHKTYREIAQEMFSLADAAVMSAKKDALVNMGGFLAMNNDNLARECTNVLIITEGYATYGGLSGRDMEAIAIGFEEVFREDYLNYRIKSTTYVGEKLHELGVPLIRPIGGHAVYIDAKAFYPLIPTHEYPGQRLACDLYLFGGIRSCEIGSVMFGKYDNAGKLIPARQELVRLAIPRRVYTQSHMDYVIETFAMLMELRNQRRGFSIAYEPPLLRHFTAHFVPLG